MSKASNIANLRWAKQSAQASPASASVFGAALSGGTQPKPNLVDEDFLETTGLQMLSDRYRSIASVAGDPQHYVMPEMIGSIAYGVLGAVTTSGGSDPYQHLCKPAVLLPWWTVWRMLSNLVWERFVDCKIVKVVLHGEWGKPLTVTVTWLGLKPQAQTAEETTVAIEKTFRFMHANGAGALLLEGSAVASLDNWDLTIDRGGALVGGDSVNGADVSEGQMMVTLAARRLFLTAALKNRLGYGSATPTNNTDAVAAILELAGSPAGVQFTFTRQAASPGPERSLKIAIPRVTVQPYDLDPATSSDPLKEQFTLQALAPADGSDPIQVTVKNGRATVF